MSGATDSRVRRVEAAFGQHFGGPPTWRVQAPGRVNLIGEHTDYNDGFVLPCAIDFGTVIGVRARDDMQVRTLALDCGPAEDRFALDQPIVARSEAPWASYVRGVVSMMLEAGLPLRGADLVISGDVPQGAGLSSSASLEVAVGQAFKALCGLDTVDPTRLARIAQAAENRFVGCNCGIMDPLISARGEAGHALLIDCRSLATRPVALPQDAVVAIVHSRVRRGLVDSQYNQRRAQCEQAARHLGAASLRDVAPEQLEGAEGTLDALAFRRARHVLSENQRTLDAAAALERGDLAALGRLMAESHLSMRDDFEITVPAVDQLVAILQEAIGSEGGARMTGGGFGGCVVAVLPGHRVPAAEQAVARHYRSPEGESARLWVCRPSAGAGLLDAAG